MINIKPVKKGDLLKLIEIEKDVFDYSLAIQEFENYFYEDTIKIWKVLNRKIIGFVSFYHVKDEIEIIQLCIIKPHQRKRKTKKILKIARSKMQTLRSLIKN